jgi:hypothetical protein
MILEEILIEELEAKGDDLPPLKRDQFMEKESLELTLIQKL